jgi:hypothetical protein
MREQAKGDRPMFGIKFDQIMYYYAYSLEMQDSDSSRVLIASVLVYGLSSWTRHFNIAHLRPHHTCVSFAFMMQAGSKAPHCQIDPDVFWQSWC